MVSTWSMKIQETLKHKRDHLHSHLKFLRVSIFILVLIAVHAALEASLAAVLITHLTGDGLQLPYAASIVNVQDGISAFLVLLVAYVSDTLLGSFGTVVLTNIFYFSGLLLLLIGAWAEKEGMRSLLVAAVFIAVGRSGRDVSLKQFLELQCKAEWRVDNTKCWRIAYVTGVIVSICVSWVYKGVEWVELCKISVTAMGLGFGFFLAGIPFYHVIDLPQGCATKLVGKTKHLSPTSSSSSSSAASVDRDTYAGDTEMRVKKDANVEAFEITEEVKKTLSMIPMWLAFLVYGLLQATASVFFYEQFSYMKPDIGHLSNIPVVVFAVIIKSTSFIASQICEKHKTSGGGMLMRIGIGLSIAPVCCVIAWRVESYRSETQGVSASVAWLIPQFVLLGALDGLVSVGIRDFFEDDDSSVWKRLKCGAAFASDLGHFASLAIVLSLGSLFGFGNGLDRSRLGLYYALLGYVCFVNFMYYCFVATYFVKPRQDEETVEKV